MGGGGSHVKYFSITLRWDMFYYFLKNIYPHRNKQRKFLNLLQTFLLLLITFPRQQTTILKLGNLGDSSVLHCEFLLRTIFASLAPANERVRVQKERNVPQAKAWFKRRILHAPNQILI